MMTYIILAAGKGNNLQPLTLKYAKTSYKLDEETTVLQRMVRSIRHADKNAEIVVVVGYKAEEIKKELDGENVVFVMNPFYEVTNSISSVWFARDYLERENVAIVHGDAVFSDDIVSSYLTVPTDHPYVLVDSSYVRPGAYNAVTQRDQVLVMSVNPGFGGQSLIPETLDKIRELVQLREKMGLSFLIEIDGGVKLSNLDQVLDAGTDIIVAGSAIFGKDTAGGTREFLQRIGE